MLPLIEEATAVDEIDHIAALPTVDGIQIGPTDLSTSRGRGAYRRTPADLEDFDKCVDAMDRVGKPWIFPAWSPFEQEWALSKQSPMILLGMQYYVMLGALSQARESFDVLESQQRLATAT